MRRFPRFAVALAATAGLTCAALPASATENDTVKWTALEAADAPIANPLKGFFPFAPEDGSAPKAVDGALSYTMEWAYFPVNAVVTGRDTYDFTKVDALLDAIAARGDQSAIRFYLDYPTRPTGVPQYLIDAGIDTSRSYTVFDNNNVSFSPDYNDPAVQEMLLHFVDALGKKYDGDPRIGYITAGLIGFWGEDHTWPMNGEKSSDNPKGENWMPSDEFRASLVAAWDKAFDKTFVQYRLPTSATKEHHMGYHDDSFAYSTLDNVDWHFMSHMKNQNETDAWQSAPIGGEVYPPLQTCIFSQPLNCAGAEAERAQGRNFDMMGSIKATHATWLINEKAFTVGYQGDDMKRAEEANAAMGYTLQATKAAASITGNDATVSVEIANTGVAPFCASWPIEGSLVDGVGSTVASQIVESPLPSITPGTTGTVTAHVTVPAARGGARAVADELTATIRVVNPLPNGAPVLFANRDMNTMLPGALTLTAVQRMDATNAPSPTPQETATPSDPASSPAPSSAPAAASAPQATQPTTSLARTGTNALASLVCIAAMAGAGTFLYRRAHRR